MASPPLRYVITGAARGIGRGLSLALVSAGHAVYMLDSDWAESANTHALAREAFAQVQARARAHAQALLFSNSGGAADAAAAADAADAMLPPTFRRVDLANPSAIREAVAEISTVFGGRIDVLVNNAFPTSIALGGGGMDDATLSEDGNDPALEAWNTQIAVGLTAPYLLSRLCVPLLVAAASSGSSSPGCIVNISSTRAHQAEPGHEAYSAAKAGLLGLTRAMAASLGSRHAIRVNAILPGWIDVAHECALGDKAGASWGQNVSEEEHRWQWVGRVGKVDDVVGAVEFLASAGFVTGQELVLDGGVTTRMVYPE